MKNIHVIPTDKPSRLRINSKGKLILSNIAIGSKGETQHIYITSDEEIKEGIDQWYLDKVLNKPYNSGGAQYSSKQDVIILTTDEDLIKDSVQAINNEFLEWFVKNPSCEKVEVTYGVLKPFQSEDKGYLIHCPDNEVLEEPKQLTDLEIAIKLEEIEREEDMQETLEEVAEIGKFAEKKYLERLDNFQKVDFKDGFIEGAKWQQERMYSEEEVKQIIDAALICIS